MRVYFGKFKALTQVHSSLIPLNFSVVAIISLGIFSPD